MVHAKNLMTLAMLMCSFLLNAQKANLKDTAVVLDRLFSNWGTTTPGGVLLISREGDVLYHKAFGMADLEHNVINTTETIFEAGSVSKQFTAAAVLILVNEGKITLKDDIRKHFPDFPDYGHTITIEHLLHHTSGLRDWGSVAGFAGWPRGTRVYNPAYVRDIIWKQKELNFKPGDEYSYSNSNYNMLAFLVEKVSGQSLQTFTAERLFRPMGMSHTKWRDNYRELIPNRAVGYSAARNTWILNMPFENTFGHAALLTTAEDLDKWNQHWRNNVANGTINELQKTKVRLNNGQPISYASAVIVDKFNDKEQIFHNGATAGYRSWLAFYPENNLSVTFLSNAGNVDPSFIGRAVASIFLGDNPSLRKKRNFQPVALDRKVLETKTGLYVNHTGEDLQEIVFQKDSLQFKNGSTLIPLEENKYFTRAGSVITYVNNNNSMQLIVENAVGDTTIYSKVKAFSPSINELESIAGIYYSEEADAKLTGVVKDNRLQFFMSPESFFYLTPAYTDAFFDQDMVLYKIVRNKKNQITGFTVTSGRVRNLLFVKIKQPV